MGGSIPRSVERHDARRVAAFMAEDVIYEDLAQGAVFQGQEGVERYVEQTHQFSSDYRFVTLSFQASGDRYAIEWEMLGTNTGDAGGFPATNKPYRFRGVSVGQLDGDGKVLANHDYWNLADYLSQVGLLELPAS